MASFSIERSQNSAWSNIGSVSSLGNSSTGHHYNFRDENVVNGNTYSYRLAAHNLDGTIEYNSHIASATPGHSEVVSGYALEQNYPNPFNPTTTISFSIAEAGFVKLYVYDLSGRVVANLVNNELSPNTYSVTLNGAGITSGMYFYRLETANFSATKKLMLMK